jgi:phenylacetate-CoA ligase
MTEGVLFPAPRDPKQKFWDPDAQTMDPEERRALQDQRVHDLVGRALLVPVPFFARKLNEIGVTDPRDISTVDDLAGIPVTVKQELRDSEQAAPPVGDYRFSDLAQCVRMGTSTGTTGIPTIRLWTRHDLWVEYESAARHWWRNGWRPGMSITHAHPGYLYGGGLLLQGAYEYFGFLAIWVPPPDTDELAEQGIRTWMRMRPDIPFGHYSVGRFCEVATKLGLDPFDDVGLEQSHYPGPGADAPLTSGGSECYAFVSSPCHSSPGGHVNEDWVVIEAIDQGTGMVVPDGEWGSLTLTTLDRDNPLLRYDLEEAVKLLREPCPCGETTVRALWGGRVAHLLHAQGQQFQVADIERALLTIPEVSTPSLEFVVVRPNGSDTRVTVRVERGESTGDTDALRIRCETAIIDDVGVRAEVELVDRGSLPRSGYKTARLVDA